MSQEALNAFWKRIKTDDALRKELAGLESAADAMDRIIVIAEREGFTFTTEEFTRGLEQRANDLSDEQLDGVAGGLLLPAVQAIRVERPDSRAIIAVLVGL